MASSNVMQSNSVANSVPTRQPSPYSLADPTRTFGSLNMDDLLCSIYGDNPTAEILPPSVGESNGGEEMTLEDFLARAGAVTEDDVRVRVRVSEDSLLSSRFQQQQMDGVDLGFVNGVERGGGRGKRRAAEAPEPEPVVNRVAAQRQKRMIKNRESAARSRERKQAYTVELESLVMQLEEENARLGREQAEQTKKRLQQLMENVIPVHEKQRPPRSLRKTRSINW